MKSLRLPNFPIRFAAERDPYLLLRMWWRWTECAYVSFRRRGLQAEIEFPSEWHEHRMGWVRIGLGFVTVAFGFPWKWLAPDHGQCSGPQYGFAFHDDALWVYFGQSTGRSRDPRKYWHIDMPWQWRYVRQSWYGLSGEEVQTRWETESREVRRAQYEWQREFEKNELPKAVFAIEDYDGDKREATTFIEEREWRFGRGVFKWLSIFRKPMVKRTLSIELNEEVGPEKGSWKGGLMGTSIDLLPGELHEAAFARWCALGDTGRGRGRGHPLKVLRVIPADGDGVDAARNTGDGKE